MNTGFPMPPEMLKQLDETDELEKEDPAHETKHEKLLSSADLVGADGLTLYEG
jgi:hypothetical protein